MSNWPILSRYKGAHLREIAMPVGGIGTGFFCLGGRGQLTDWQLMGRPNRGWRPMYSHLLLRTRQVTPQGEQIKLRILEGDLTEGLAADFGAPQVLAGLPRTEAAGFEAAYPFGQVRLEDDHLPLSATVAAYNPLIPHDVEASSLPMGLLTVTLTNRTKEPVEASLTLLLSNFIGTDGIARDLKDNVTEHAEVDGWKGMLFRKVREARTAQNGTLAVLCDAKDVRVARRWPFRDRPWNGETLGIIDSLLGQGYIADDEPEKPCPPSPDDTWDSSLTAMVDVPARKSVTIRLLVTWRFPWRNLAELGWWSGAPGADPLAENHYATRFTDAVDVARQVIPRLGELQTRSAAFVKMVNGRRAPQPLKEAALFTLAHLRTHTCFRLADGVFYGFEGCGPNTGCCIGSCSHVWNYEEATISLFPELHRSMLESHLKHGVTPSGAERFRISLPIANQTWGAAAADGQMGLIVRTWQQYLADADRGGQATLKRLGAANQAEYAAGRERKALEWLKGVWPQVKAMLQFAWVEGGWDADRDGVMEGVQHNTYDVEFVGPNPMCTVWYLAALAAGAKMARAVGDEAFARECDRLRESGSRLVDGSLYDGRFYIQHVQQPKAPPAPMTSLSSDAMKPDPPFQVGPGCLIDQLVGQYKANRARLGDLLDSAHLRTAVHSIFRHNFREHFRDHYNNMRTFATADESGTLIASYPNGGRPAVPFPYWSECMTGFEYQLAVLLLDYGFREEGTKVAKAVRDRHNGANRNPFNEPECGSHYARAMAAWALLDAWDRSPNPS